MLYISGQEVGAIWELVFCCSAPRSGPNRPSLLIIMFFDLQSPAVCTTGLHILQQGSTLQTHFEFLIFMGKNITQCFCWRLFIVGNYYPSFVSRHGRGASTKYAMVFVVLTKTDQAQLRGKRLNLFVWWFLYQFWQSVLRCCKFPLTLLVTFSICCRKPSTYHDFH